MFSAIDRMYLGILNWMHQLVTGFQEDEAGITAFVGVILLILIVIIMAALFQGYIKDWIDAMWAKIISESPL